ncbi:hypothetical protein CLV59_10713 [Chitinophaga dinghuensis]|uniref:Uncharacterized protein n=1 Tax=Chitinophaga dinghuensis TaxID=1539050 RepID=A0A327VTH3_9BACT|nr:hypothetical protein [Chitinophaga dinghuensis]RAJ77248.1 hypothetical protein CLV59_10713 [Chitinophaga dinghuensis]
MSQDKFPRKLIRKEVERFINGGEAVYDGKLSKEFNFPVYKFLDGRLIFKRDDGTGVYWQSKSIRFFGITSWSAFFVR